MFLPMLHFLIQLNYIEDGLHLCNHPSPLSEAQAISVATTPAVSQTVPDIFIFFYFSRHL